MDELKQKALALAALSAGLTAFEHPKGYLSGKTHFVVRTGRGNVYGNTPIEALAAAAVERGLDPDPSLLQQAPVLTPDARRSLEWFLRNATLDPVDPEAGGHHQTLKDFLSRSSQGVTMEQVEKAVSVVNARRHATYTDYVCDILKALGIPVEGAG